MESKIIDLDHFGRGISKNNGKIIFIPKCLPDETVKYRIIKEKKNFAEAKLCEIITKSSKRIDSICPYFENCGGCQFLNLNYQDTIEYKVKKAHQILNVDNINVIECQNNLNYRNKINLKIENNLIGYYKENSHELIPIDYCYIAKNSINTLIKDYKLIGITNGNLTIRSNYNDELLIIIETNEKVDINITKLKEKHKIIGIIVNKKIVNGENHFIEIINNKLFNVSYDSFFQTNNEINSKIFELLDQNISQDAKVLDLYCGVGSLGQSISPKISKLYGIEINENAIKNALINAKMNKIINSQYFLGNITSILTKIPFDFDTVILDPPRSGVIKRDLEYLLEKEPNQIFYISCDLMTLKRDLDILNTKYKTDKIILLDMFPYTYHIESFVILKKA